MEVAQRQRDCEIDICTRRFSWKFQLPFNREKAAFHESDISHDTGMKWAFTSENSQEALYLGDVGLRLLEFALVARHFALELLVVVLQTRDQVPHLPVDRT